MQHRTSSLLRIKQLFASVLSALLFCITQPGFSATTKDFIDSGTEKDLIPSGKGWGEHPNAKSQELANFPGKSPAAKSPTSKTGSGISYHGGPVMTSNTSIYYIWYGNWSGNSATSILTDFANNIGGSPYYNINTTYYNGSGSRVLNNSSSPKLFSTQATVTDYPYGTSLSDANIQQIVTAAITPQGSTQAALPNDPNGVYFVLTSSDVNESSGFCTKYCGWHTHGLINGSDIKFSFVGNPDRCPSACEWQSTSPNGNAGADGMASIIAHELEEAATDPDLNAWYDSRGRENADKCAWSFGTTSTASNGSLYNVTLGARNYLIQQNWVNALSGYCKMYYP